MASVAGAAASPELDSTQNSTQNEHVRRLATEGTRAYPPWAKRVPWLLAHPRATRAILDASYQDPAEYVRRSAANHLNDLSRIDPAATIETAAGWTENSDGNTSWVLRHGLRTLVKQGNAEALSILGFFGESLSFLPPQINNERIPWDGSVEFNCQVTNGGKSEAAVAVDYIVGFQRANGSISSKTFKLTTQKIMPGETIMASKTHSFRPITTRKYYPGAHTLTLQINGQQSSPVDFTLEARPLLDK